MDHGRGLAPGTLIAGDWRVERTLGVGGFGVTYEARNPRTQAHVALKEYMPAGCCSRDPKTSHVTAAPGREGEVFRWGLERFMKEAETLARLEHPSIVRVTTIFEANGTAYMGLAFEPDGTLREWLDGLGRRPTGAEIDALLWPLLDALSQVHSLFLLHRDIKPDNIMVRADGTPVLIDFGAARSAVAGHTQTLGGVNPAATSAFAVVSDGYSPPEQYDPTGRMTGPASDIYSLGGTIYTALVGGRLPSAASRHFGDDYQPLAVRLAGQGYRPELLTGIDRALAVHPKERPQSAIEFRRAIGLTGPPREPGLLSRALMDVATEHGATRPPPLPSGPRPVTFSQMPISAEPKASRSRAPVAIVAGLVAVVLSAGAFWLAQGRPELSALFGQRQPAAPIASVPTTPAPVAKVPTRPAQAPGPAPVSETATERERHATEVWDAIKSTREIGILERYVVEYGGTKGATEARNRLRDLHQQLRAAAATKAWEPLAKSTDEAALERFAAEWREMPSAEAALARLAEVRRLRAEREARERRAAAAGQLIKGSRDVATLTKFIADFDGTPAAAEVRRQLAALDPAQSVAPGSGTAFRDRLAGGEECASCPEMVVVPAGRFTMGSPDSEPQRIAGSEDQVAVTIPRPFVVGKFEVTFAEWDACRSDGGCSHNPGDQGWGLGTRPVINVSWNDAREYVAWLSRKTGRTYRLLSEAEWEYVARAGTTTPFWWGSSITPSQANYDGSEEPYPGGGSKGEYRKQTVAVDSFRANAWGLHDVHGNVFEWTEDCWNETNGGNPANGSARTSDHCSRRVLRGGSWLSYPRLLRSAFRDWGTADVRSDDFGFRVGRTL